MRKIALALIALASLALALPAQAINPQPLPPKAAASGTKAVKPPLVNHPPHPQTKS